MTRVDGYDERRAAAPGAAAGLTARASGRIDPGMRILVVEDDARIGAFIARGLSEEGHVVDAVRDAAQALEHCAQVDYDAIVVDWMLPGQDGVSFIGALRADGDRTPALMLSARREVEDRVEGLRGGADDYLTKPFSFAELVARLEALTRRAGGAPAKADPAALEVGNLRFDLRTRRVTRAGEALDLQPKELVLLEYLMRNAGRVVTRTMILEHVWDYDFDPQTNVVDVLVSRLRKKVDREFDEKLIHTLRGRGYVMRREAA